jgi:hypothetical protein
VLLCENGSCRSHGFDTVWTWARGVMPQLRDFSTTAPQLRNASRLLSNGSLTLYLARDFLLAEPTQDGPCIGLHFTMRDEQLVAFIDSNGKQVLEGSRGCTRQLILGYHAEICNTEGLGSCSYLGSGRLLSHVDDASIEYDGVWASISPYCRELITQRPGCEPPECRSCQLELEERHMGGMGYQSKHRSETVRTLADSGCPSCPPDPMNSLVARLQHIARGRSFFRERGDPGAFRAFRQQSDCETHVLASRAEEQ